jgi:hypothetical protein
VGGRRGSRGGTSTGCSSLTTEDSSFKENSRSIFLMVAGAGRSITGNNARIDGGLVSAFVGRRPRYRMNSPS